MQEVDFEVLDERAPENVAAIVTKFIKLMPESFVTTALSPSFKACVALSDKLPALQQLFKQLPHENRETLRFLADHFIQVAANSKYNLMHAENITRTLGIMFGEVFSMVIRTLMDNPLLCHSTIVFGIPIEDAARISDPLGLIPSPLKVCIEHIEKNALWTDDLYIASGNWIKINDWKDKFNRAENVDLSHELDVDIVTGVIKLYIHDIPENILTRKLRDQFMTVAESKAKGQDPVPELRKLVAQLPPPHRASSELLFMHLKRVRDNSHGEVLPFHLGSCFGGLYRTWFPLFLPVCTEVFAPEKKS